jgi:hypothetical protein
MAKNKSDLIVPDETVMNKILVIRGKKVMIDRDLAELYGVTTKRLNEQVKRNIKRFPVDFMYQLTEEEKEEVVAICDHLKSLKYSPQLPYVFDHLKQLLIPPEQTNRQRIGFRRVGEKG